MGRSRLPTAVADDDDDDGFSSKTWVPGSQRAAQGQTVRKSELEDEALQRNTELTNATLKLRRITEETKGVASQTLVTLQEQGEQINRIHVKAVQMDQELEKGEKLLGKLGPFFGLRWKPKKGKKITGPKASTNARDTPACDTNSRQGLGLDKGKKGESVLDTSGMTVMERLEAEKKFQEEVLDGVSDGLDVVKKMALEMGRVMGEQEEAIDDVGDDLKELNNRLDQSVKREHRLLDRK